MGVLRVGLIEPHPTLNNRVRLTWSEAVNTPAATTAGNYTLSGGATCSAAAMVAGSGNTQTDLTLTGLALSTTYELTVANVQDAASSTAIVSPNEKGRFIWRESGDNNLNGVVHEGGMIPQRANRNFTGDQLLGYNVLGSRDLTPPVISNVTPVGANIQPTTVVGFDATDTESPFRRIIIKAHYVDGTWDLVWDGDQFGPKFQGASNTRVALSMGYRFTILKDGGWTVGNGLTLTPYAIDTGGNENI